ARQTGAPHQMLFLSDPIPPAGYEVKPDVSWVVLEPVPHDLQPKLVMVDGACDDRPKFLLGEGEPVRRFDRLVKIEPEIIKKETRHCMDFDGMIYRTILDFLQVLDVVVVRIGLRVVGRVAAETHRELLPQRLSNRARVALVITLTEKQHRPRPPVMISRHLSVKTDHL